MQQAATESSPPFEPASRGLLAPLIRAVSPFGPIFGKELRTAARRKRNYLLRVVYLALLLLFLLLAWASTRNFYAYGTGAAARMQQQEMLGFEFFMSFSMFSVIAMFFIGPVLTSTAISDEKLHRTLHVLLMTPLTAWQIVSGKLFSRLLGALTLIGLSLPVLALVRLLGGVELQQMFGVLALCVSVAMISAAVGLLFSILMPRAYATILSSYLLLGVVYLFVPFIMMVWMRNLAATRMPWEMYLTRWNPLWCTAWLASGESRVESFEWLSCAGIHLAATGVLLVLCAVLVRRLARREGGGSATAASALGGSAEGASTARAKDHSDPATPAPVRRREISDAPVLWRELRRPLMNKRSHRIIGAGSCIVLLLVTYYTLGRRELRSNDTQIGFAIIFEALITLLACVLSATAITQEKESDTWALLLACPLSGSQIIWGKTLGVLRRMLWPYLLFAAHFFAFTLAGVISPAAFVMTMWILFSFNVVWIATGIFLSLWLKKVTFAVTLNLFLPFIAYAGVALVLSVFDQLLQSNERLSSQVAWYMPYYYLGEGIHQLRPGWGPGTHLDLPLVLGISFGRNMMQVSPFTFLLVVYAVGFAQLALARLVILWTETRFETIVGRAAQLVLAASPSSPFAQHLPGKI